MSEEVEGVPINIYVLPTEEDKPPRAYIMRPQVVPLDDERVPQEVREAVAEAEKELPPEQQEVEAGVVIGVVKTTVTWSRDNGTWVDESGNIIDTELGEVITEHAKSLGVEW